jgi:H-type lectin domain
MQAGTFLAGGGAAQLKVVTIFFPSAFSTIPKITVTPRNEAGTNNNDVYAVTVRSITATGVVINILRVDVAAGWGQNLQLDWQAWTQ